EGIHHIRTIITDIAQTGTTILMASHLLDEVEKICDQVIIIRQGKKLYEGPVEALNAGYGFMKLKTVTHTQALLDLLNAHPAFSSVKVGGIGLVRAVLEKPLAADELNRFLFQKDIVLTHLVKRQESLENRFLHLTNSKN